MKKFYIIEVYEGHFYENKYNDTDDREKAKQFETYRKAAGYKTCYCNNIATIIKITNGISKACYTAKDDEIILTKKEKNNECSF